MPATKKLISTITVPSEGATSVLFDGIPQNFTDIQIVCSSRSDANPFGVAVSQIGLSANGGSTGWSSKALGGNGSSAYTETGSGSVTQSSVSTSNIFASGLITICNYASTTQYKSGSTESTIENNATASWMALHAIQWPSNSALTSLSLYPISGKFIQGSTFSLYGMVNGNGGSSVDIVRYEFNSGVEGWTANNANLSASGGILTEAVTNNDAHMMSPSLSFSGAAGRYIKVVVKPVNAGQAVGWDGSVFYSTTGHGYSESYKGMMTQPTWDGTYKTITLDMWNPFAGGSDWQNSTITSIRLDFGNSFADGNFLIDSISISPNP